MTDEFGHPTTFIRVLTFLGVVIALGFLLTRQNFDRQQPRPTTPQQSMFGCYLAADAPPIRLDNSGLRVGQRGMPAIPFTVERSKPGLVVVIDQWLTIIDMHGRYRFDLRPRPGRMIDVVNVVNDIRHGATDSINMTGLAMQAEDGAWLHFARRAASACEAADV